MRVSICIPTFRQPEGLTRAAESVFAQVGLLELDVELIVIDNSPEGGAMRLLAHLQESAPIALRHAHERRAGLAFARNAALRIATGDLIAWLDDDQEAAPLWLDRLLAARATLKADIVFGPIAGAAPEGPHRAYFEEIHSRIGPATEEILAAPLGIGNSLMTRAVFAERLAPFDPHTDEIGRGDEAFLADCAERGAVFGWAAGARVTERVCDARANARYAMKRAFANGQTAAARGDRLTRAKHMIAGAAQMLAYGAAASAAALLRRPGALPLWHCAARGAGKLLWFRKQTLYAAG